MGAYDSRSHPFSRVDCVVCSSQFYDNAVAGIHIVGSNNFTFEATIASDSFVGSGRVGTLDGQQPIEVVIETSSLVHFQDMAVFSANGEFELCCDVSQLSRDTQRGRRSK